MDRRTTVLLADDHAILSEGLRGLLEPAFDVVGSVTNGRALVEAAAHLKPDVIVVDVSMPLLTGVEAARQIRQHDGHAKIVFLSMHADPVYASEAMLAGGSAYLLKTSDAAEIVAAIRQVLRGGTYMTSGLDRQALQTQLEHKQRRGGTLHSLSPRQREVLRLTAEGHSTKEIATVLDISPRTVEFHRYRLMRSLGMHSTAGLVQYAIRHRLIVPSG
jgi:DNA-binding NarL/FixJ family response regulator